jgi:hypothetical protein
LKALFKLSGIELASGEAGGQDCSQPEPQDRVLSPHRHVLSSSQFVEDDDHDLVLIGIFFEIFRGKLKALILGI